MNRATGKLGQLAWIFAMLLRTPSDQLRLIEAYMTQVRTAARKRAG
jgi:hypothetical protein